MKKTLKILTILLLSSTTLFGQKISSIDSLKVAEAFTALFAAIDSEDLEALDNMSTDKIYCIICSNSPDLSDSPYMYDKKDFLENHLKKIKNSESYQRATKSDELILVKENDHRTDITAFWTIYQRNELAPGHEGGQFGIYFKKINGEYKFAGMETIP
tara:strand:- start:47 stop:520 length:474 start_codon:yes stop_codon:yes gene_type:complete